MAAVESYSQFELAMASLMHELYGSTTESNRKQLWWKQVEDLKLAAVKSQWDSKKEAIEIDLCNHLAYAIISVMKFYGNDPMQTYLPPTQNEIIEILNDSKPMRDTVKAVTHRMSKSIYRHLEDMEDKIITLEQIRDEFREKGGQDEDSNNVL